jgi:phage baseplate assembly protein W
MSIVMGAALPFKVSPLGGFTTKTDNEKIADNIRAILISMKGERLMSPQFGLGAYNMIFRNLTEAELPQLIYAIRTAIETGDARVAVTDIKVEAPNAEGRVLVHISYIVDYSQEQTVSVYLTE